MEINERREQSRLRFSGEVTFEGSASLTAGPEERRIKGRGVAADISESGLCLTTQDIVEEDQILKINLPLPGVPVQTPSLVTVRWVRRENGGYAAGMMFVL
jgi:hypothetical protein